VYTTCYQLIAERQAGDKPLRLSDVELQLTSLRTASSIT
jgi:hypothetical protein